MNEQEFQQHLRIALTSKLGIRVWRQPSGKIRTDRGTWVECAPVGAADLSGIVSTEGFRLEIECKGLRTHTPPERIRRQEKWRELIQQWGGIALQVRGPDVDHAVQAIAEAIAQRRARG